MEALALHVERDYHVKDVIRELLYQSLVRLSLAGGSRSITLILAYPPGNPLYRRIA
jgi:hypothetical protein